MVACLKSAKKKIYLRLYSSLGPKGVRLEYVSPASQTVAQHYISIGPMYRVIWVVAFLATGGAKRHPAVQANTGKSPTAVLIPGQCRRRWANIETVLGKWHLCAAAKYTADSVL